MYTIPWHAATAPVVCLFCFVLFYFVVRVCNSFSTISFLQVIELIDYKAEDDDDCYELQNILSDPHVAVCGEINCEP